jgi:hypothetical protein
MKIASSILLFINEDFMLPCMNKQILGIECTGCGIQRAAVLLLSCNLSLTNPYGFSVVR